MSDGEASAKQPPRVDDVWRKNDGSGRTVRVLDVDGRWAYVQNVETGRRSNPELSTFTRSGKSGWIRVDGTFCPGDHGEQCCGDPRSCVASMYGAETVR